jgi:hypothetical protein
LATRQEGTNVTVFVSRHAKHNHEIWSGNQEYMNVNGSPKMVTKMPALSVQFEPRRLTELQRRTAAQAFGMIPYGRDLIMLPNSVDAGHPDDGWRPGYSAEAAATAYPRAHDDVVIGVSGEAVATTGYDPQFNLGSYDTGSDHNDQSGMIPYQSVGARSEKERKAVWDEVEAVLRASPDFGRSIIAIDEQTIPPPFPGYVKSEGRHGGRGRVDADDVRRGRLQLRPDPRVRAGGEAAAEHDGDDGGALRRTARPRKAAGGCPLRPRGDGSVMEGHDIAVRRLDAWQSLVRETEVAEAAKKDGRAGSVWLSARQARDVIDHHNDTMRGAYAPDPKEAA